MGYFKVCPHCGANLDPGEVCDCVESKYERLTPENKEKLNALIVKLIEKQNAPAGATNTDGGRVEQSLTDTDSTSTINENGGFVK